MLPALCFAPKQLGSKGGTALTSAGSIPPGDCRYYSQKLALNECVFRHRQMYDYIAVIDRDEFIYVKDKPLKHVDLPAILHSIIGGTPFASVGMFTARYVRVSSFNHAPDRLHVLQLSSSANQPLNTLLCMLSCRREASYHLPVFSWWVPLLGKGAR